MIAMQYSFVLPADYDMEIIERRIRTKGPLLDGFPHLRFKAYLSARNDDDIASAENLYAPFYLWDHADGLSDFLADPGFATLTRDFGWPAVRTWMVWHAELAQNLGEACFASREIETIAPYSDLAARRAAAIGQARASVGNDAIAAIAAFEPTGWTFIRFRLWRALPQAIPAGAQLYAVGHMSLPLRQETRPIGCD
jgi:hypothetical protein